MYLGRLPVRWAKNSRGWGGGGGWLGGEDGGSWGGCTLQGDRGLARWWQHQNLTSHPFRQQSPLHIMCREIKSICFERATDTVCLEAG